MEGRARLYERRERRLHALDALRVGTVAAAREAPAACRAHATVDEIVGRRGRPDRRDRATVRRLLIDDEPATDADLVRLSDELLHLERDVQRAVRGR